VERIIQGWHAGMASPIRLALLDLLRNSQPEEFAQTPGLHAADGDLSALFVVHPELVAGLKPGNDFLDVIDVHQEAAMGTPEDGRIEIGL
jgi:hypothetical protein